MSQGSESRIRLCTAPDWRAFAYGRGLYAAISCVVTSLGITYYEMPDGSHLQIQRQMCHRRENL